jgi:hypothetical protein
MSLGTAIPEPVIGSKTTDPIGNSPVAASAISGAIRAGNGCIGFREMLARVVMYKPGRVHSITTQEIH